jgi:hypothetical protein
MPSFLHSKNAEAFGLGSLPTALQILSLSLFCLNSPVMAEPIKSADGKVIDAEVIDIRRDGVTLKRAGVKYDVPFEKLDQGHAASMKAVRWLKVDIDKFEDKITAATKELGCSDLSNVYVKALVSLKPMKLDLPKRFSLWFVHNGEDWMWLSYHKVNLLLDDKPFGELESEIETSTLSGGKVLEIVTTELSDEQMANICNAKKVEVRVGTQEFTLDQSQLDGLVALREYFEWARGVAIRNSADKALKEGPQIVD